MIEFEVALIFYTTLFFTILYFIAGKFGMKALLGTINIICWFILSLTFFAIPATFQGVSWLFLGIGFIFMLFTVKDVFDQIQVKKHSLEP